MTKKMAVLGAGAIGGTIGGHLTMAGHDVETEMAYRATERGEGLPSLLQDLTKGRSTEIHFLNGYVSDKGKRVGVPTPINQALTSLVTRIEKEGLKPDISNLRFLEPHVS